MTAIVRITGKKSAVQGIMGRIARGKRSYRARTLIQWVDECSYARAVLRYMQTEGTITRMASDELNRKRKRRAARWAKEIK